MIKLKPRTAWLLSGSWALVIFVLSSIPGGRFPEVHVVHADKMVHVVIYGLLGSLFYFALRTSTHQKTLFSIAAATFLTTLYGASDETHQLFVRGRSADLFDIAADMVGGLLGVCATALFFRSPVQSDGKTEGI